MTDTQSADHYHVFAVQDWGGRTEYARGWDDQLDRAAAEAFADDVILADSSWHHPERYEALLAEFGEERLDDLVSTDVNPGWEAVWIVGCTGECRFGELFHGELCEHGESLPGPGAEWGDPYWPATTVTCRAAATHDRRAGGAAINPRISAGQGICTPT